MENDLQPHPRGSDNKKAVAQKQDKQEAEAKLKHIYTEKGRKWNLPAEHRHESDKKDESLYSSSPF